MNTSQDSILFVADQPWQIRIFMAAVEVINRKNSDLDCVILFSDYYTFLHQEELMRELDTKKIKYQTMSHLFREWQDKSEPVLLNEQRDKLEKFFQDVNLLSRLEKTNPWIFGDERSAYYLKMSNAWREKIFLDTVDWSLQTIIDLAPTLVVSLERSTLPNNAIFELTKILNIPHRCLIPARIDNYWYVRKDFGREITEDFAREVLERDISAAILDQVNLWVDKFLSQRLGSYRSLEEEMTRDLPKGDISDVFAYLSEGFKLTKKAYARIFERRHITFKIRRLEQSLLKLTYFQFRQFFLRSLFSLHIWRPFEKSETSEQYFLWALHARPEGSVLALNNGRDEIEQVLNFAQNLPIGSVLLVKENIEMLGLRKRGFYKLFSKNDRIRIISPEENLADLVPNCAGIIGVSGTFLLEGAIYGKPVFALGDPEFKFLLSNRTVLNEKIFISYALSKQIVTTTEPVKKYLSYVFEQGFDLGFSMFDNRAFSQESSIVKEIVKLVT